MKNNLKKRLLVSLLILALFLPLLTFTSCEDVESENEYVSWTLSDENMTLTGNDTVYTLYYPMMSYPFYEEAWEIYEYYNEVEVITETEDGISVAYAKVYAPSPDSEFVFISFKGASYIYATETGKHQLNDFFNGFVENYYLWTGYYQSTAMDASLFDAMEAARKKTDNKRTVNVQQLAEALLYEVILYDTTNTFAYTVGAVYRLEDGTDYYLNYLSLGNQYFDADGNFSYRNGSVELTALEPSLATSLEEIAATIEDKEFVYTYEHDDTLLISKSTFLILYALICLVVPLILLLVGLLLSRSKKRGYPKRWLVLSIISAIWIFLAILLMILLI